MVLNTKGCDICTTEHEREEQFGHHHRNGITTLFAFPLAYKDPGCSGVLAAATDGRPTIHNGGRGVFDDAGRMPLFIIHAHLLHCWHRLPRSKDH